MVLFFMSCINVTRHLLFFIKVLITPEAEKYVIPNKSAVILCVSIAYIITACITGISL